MKSFTRAPWVQATLATLLASWLRLCFATMRWTVENRASAERVWAEGGGVIVCFWHSRISLSPACWPLDGEAPQEPRAMISLSPDGEFIAGAVNKLGFPAIRGSSRKATKKGHKDKGGTQAFREVLRWVRAGNCIAITPDGPRGPAETMAEGAILLAKMTGAQVLMIGFAARPAIRLDSWDKAIVPLPFSKGAIVWGDAFTAAEREDSADERKAWAERLNALTRRAEELAA